MNLNIDNRLKEYCVPKNYLSKKDFSYKLYLTLCCNMFWNTYLEEGNITRYEYILNYINIKDVITISKMSRQKILKQLNMKPYRLKTDEQSDRHLMINSPIKNYIKIDLDRVLELINEEEMTIRTYIYLYGYSNDVIYGVTNEKLLDKIGYNSNSSNNKSKLTKGINRLIDLRFIKRDIESNGLKKYSIYYKVSNK